MVLIISFALRSTGGGPPIVGTNAVTGAGLQIITQSLLWSGVEDVAASAGVSGPTFLAPVWAAAGTGSQVFDPSLRSLVTEVGRAPVNAASFNAAAGTQPPSMTMLFYLTPPVEGWTITETALFANATGSLNAGVMLDYFTFASPLTITSPDNLIIEATLTVGTAS